MADSQTQPGSRPEATKSVTQAPSKPFRCGSCLVGYGTIEELSRHFSKKPGHIGGVTDKSIAGGAP